VGPDQYARTWLDRLNPDRLFITERRVLEKASPRDEPVGNRPRAAHGRCRDHGDRARRCDQCSRPGAGLPGRYLLAGIHQDGLERDAAATMAAATATCFYDHASATGVVQAMGLTRRMTNSTRPTCGP
jgi:hypothetical protein